MTYVILAICNVFSKFFFLFKNLDNMGHFIFVFFKIFYTGKLYNFIYLNNFSPLSDLCHLSSLSKFGQFVSYKHCRSLRQFSSYGLF